MKSRSDKSRVGFGKAAVAVAATGLSVLLLAFFLWMLFPGWHGTSEAAINAQLKATLPPPLRTDKVAKLDRAAALALIPSVGSSISSLQIEGLPKDVVTAAQVATIPLSDPVALAEAMSPGDPKVLEWFRKWREKQPTSDISCSFGVDGPVQTDVPDADRNELAGLLLSSPLPWRSLFRLGDAYQQLTGDSRTTVIFYSVADQETEKELQFIAPGSDAADPILTAMNDSRRLLWDALDSYGSRPALDALVNVNADLAHWVKPGDPTLEDARRHAILGIAECQYVKGEAGEAASLLLKLDTAGMTENEQLGVAWIKALALFKANRYPEAVDQFKFVASDPSYQYSSDAAAYVAMCLWRSGDKPAAEAAFTEWISSFRPDPVTTKSFRSYMAGTPVF
ncbi:MAG: tetratricopeptide repeat protein [Tepidisphaeraceae bacterium]|jgi:hypothetical protein